MSFNLRRWLPLFLGAALVLGLAGCGDRDRTYVTEADEPYYQEGQSLLKTGRRQEALASFLKVIDKRGEDAPESHLEAGLLYLQYINDPLSAQYHFKRYLALQPNSPQAPLVRQRIDLAVREFARTLPAQSIEHATQHVDLIAALDKLKLENEQLKQQLADLQANRATATTLTNVSSPAAPLPDQPVASNDFSLSLETLPTVRTRPAQPVTTHAPQTVAFAPLVVPPPASKHETVRAKPTSPPPVTATPAKATPRKHVVQKGDTLSNLALRYYKNKAKWKEIYAANRKVMKNESDIHVGMELVIP